MFNEDKNLPSKYGYIFLQILILGLFFLIGLRLWYFQIYKGNYYAIQAQENIIRKKTVYAPRGLIFDKNGNILAENKPAFGLAIVRENCKQISKSLKQISRWTNTSLKQLKEKYQKQKGEVKPFKPQLLVNHLAFEQLSKIESQISNWPGLRIITKPLRTYTHSPLFSHVLGYVSQANKQELRNNPELELGDNIGKSGVELSFEQILRGKKGYKQLKVNARGRKLQKNILKEPKPGNNIYLTLDLDLQKYAWEVMGNKTGAIVVMEPSTGKIRAMVSKPGYPNNKLVQGINKSVWESIIANPRYSLQNRAIQNAYPPGSLFKLLLTAAALAKNKVTPKTEYYCPGFYKLGGTKFKCWNESGHGWLKLNNAIKRSCDVYFYKLGEKLGIEIISNFAKKYGFHQKTGIELPSENKGLIPNKEWKLRQLGRHWQGGDTLNTAIGQGYTLTTPLQITRYVTALANGGKLLKPLLRRDKKPVIQSRLPLSPREINIIKKAMISAVQGPHGTAWRLRSCDARIGAKTGTSQAVKLTKKKKDKDLSEIPYKSRPHAWMTSFGSKNNEHFVVTAFIEHGGHGYSAAGPVVKKIYSYLFD